MYRVAAPCRRLDFDFFGELQFQLLLGEIGVFFAGYFDSLRLCLVHLSFPALLSIVVCRAFLGATHATRSRAAEVVVAVFCDVLSTVITHHASAKADDLVAAILFEDLLSTFGTSL